MITLARHRWSRLVTFLLASAFGGGVWGAEESDADLAKAAQNPLANMVSFPFQNNTNFDVGPNNRTQNVLNIQPVIPFKDGEIITRTIIPLVWQPIGASDSSFGFGDLTLTAFYSPPSGKHFVWGVGPVLTLPTGGSDRGTQKWGLGPSVVALATPGPWVLGALANNVWSFAGDSSAPSVNFMTLQPFLNYNFPGFYLTFSPIITANWEAASGEKWTVPLGLGIGKLLRVGSRGVPININASAYDNVVKPDSGASWTLRIQAALLLPTSVFK